MYKIEKKKKPNINTEPMFYLESIPNKKKLMVFFYTALINLIYYNLYIQCNQRDIHYGFSYITLRTNITGYIQIFYDLFEFSQMKLILMVIIILKTVQYII